MPIKPGSIYNSARYCQRFDFSGFSNGKGTPSNFDLVWDLVLENVWIVGDFKAGNGKLTTGQRIALTNDLTAHYRQGRHCLGFVSRHSSHPSVTIDATKTIVTEYWLNPEDGWQKPTGKRHLGEFVDAFRAWARSQPHPHKRHRNR